MTGRILTVAESDSSGSTGIQADVKTILALGGHAMTAVSVLTAQVGHKTVDIQKVPASFVVSQMEAALQGGGVDAIKIGFLQDEETVNAVADVLDKMPCKDIPVIVDPSVVSRSGDVLVSEHDIAAWKRRLYIHATVLTPNLREAELLSGMSIKSVEEVMHAADMMRTLGVENIALKARQAFNDSEAYVIATDKEERVYERPSVKTHRTLGAGSTLSTAIAVRMGQGMDVFPAVEAAMDFLQRAIEYGSDYTGHAHETVNHAFNVLDTTGAAAARPVKFYKA